MEDRSYTNRDVINGTEYALGNMSLGDLVQLEQECQTREAEAVAASLLVRYVIQYRYGEVEQ